MSPAVEVAMQTQFLLIVSLEYACPGKAKIMKQSCIISS